MSKAVLHLIPNFISEKQNKDSFSNELISVVHQLEYFIAEKAKSTRAFIKKVEHPLPLHEIIVEEYNHKSPPEDFLYAIEGLKQGKQVGLMSEAGVPCVADPGNSVVAYAHKNNIKVVPYIGPNSIIMALMASGFNGQQFTFHGYLAHDERVQKTQIRNIENGLKYSYAQILIETPYGNQKLFNKLLSSFSSDIELHISFDLCGNQEHCETRSIADWKRLNYHIPKLPCIFILGKV